jgi:hypothetical protein
VLHRDGRWTHEGAPILNRKLRAAFDRGVRYLPEEGVYVVQLGRFRGQIELEETGFFVTGFDADTGRVCLSDRSEEPLDVTSLRPSHHDGAWLCTVKRALAPDGLPARFFQAAQAELLAAVEDGPRGPVVRMAGTQHALPACVSAS